MAERRIRAAATDLGLSINGQLFDMEQPLSEYQVVLGSPHNTIDAGSPAPAGYRNNQVHIFEGHGIYLTEHHQTRLIQSVNFAFDLTSCLFPVKAVFSGDLLVANHQLDIDVTASDFALWGFSENLAGKFNLDLDRCWIGVSMNRGRVLKVKSNNRWRLGEVSVCFSLTPQA